MQCEAKSAPFDGREADAIFIFAHENKLNFNGVNDDLRTYCLSLAEKENFDGSSGQLVSMPPCEKFSRIFLVGLGKDKPEDKRKKAVKDTENYRAAAGAATRAAAAIGCETIAITGIDMTEEARRALAEGVTLGCYRFNKYRALDKKDRFKEAQKLIVWGTDELAMAKGVIAARAQNYTRSLCNEPGNVINPGTLAQEAKSLVKNLAKEYDVTCVVREAGELAAMGMGALLSVGKGSSVPPCLIHLKYAPKNPTAKVVIIGKGLTFDSGGLDLKPSEHMRTMKGDKTGACAALGVFKGACEMSLPVELHVIIGAAENMPGGNAYRPDDVIKAYNGKTIEIDNTDAEGRLTLADALAYACELKPSYIVDVATLTGACAVALGENTAGIFGNDEALISQLLFAAAGSGERMWQLPMDDPFLKKQLKSNIADLVNSGGRYGGAITAAMFLESFVSDSTPWAHIDIAAVDVTKEARDYYVKGATGFSTRTLLKWLEEGNF